ncbi:MAG: hypothetical protein WBL68_08235 [Nitrososphaeraceae archaeon]
MVSIDKQHHENNSIDSDLLMIAFIIVVFLVGSGMLFGKATAQVDLQKEMLIAEFHVLSNIPNLFETRA